MSVHVEGCLHLFGDREGERMTKGYTGPSGALLAAQHCNGPMTRER